MSTATEIEKAIRTLPPIELAKLRERLGAILGPSDSEDEGIRAKAIYATAGCLPGREGEAFAAAVEEAGSNSGDDHAW